MIFFLVVVSFSGRDEVRVSRNRVPYPCRKTKLRDRVGGSR